MKTLANRVAIVVTAKGPYFEWARSIDAGAAGLEMGGDNYSTVFLVDAGDMFDRDELIERHALTIFEHELNAWHRDASRWPTRRSAKMFEEWFDVALLDMIVDLGRGPIVVE